MYHKQFNVYYTLAGIYRNFPDIFDNLHVPESINKNTLIHMILDKCSSMELSYCDPVELKEIINYWSLSRLVSWERITEALISEYNPIYNYDRFENISTNGSNSEQNTHNNRIDYTGTVGNNRTIWTTENDTSGETATKTSRKTTDSTKTTNETTTHENTAYNDGLSIATRDITNGTETDNITETGTDANTVSGSETKNINTTDTNTDTYKRTDTHSGGDTSTGTNAHTENNHLYGNIGVTSSQQLIQSSIDLYVTDVYYIISEEFKAKFCNLLYIY